MCRAQRRIQSLPAALEPPVLRGIHNIVLINLRAASADRGRRERKRSPALSKSNWVPQNKGRNEAAFARLTGCQECSGVQDAREAALSAVVRAAI